MAKRGKVQNAEGSFDQPFYHPPMYIARLRIHGFRGIQYAEIVLPQNAVLIGPTSGGKSTIIDALSLVLGREQMVRDLTEHDFFGSAPEPAARIKVLATIAGFETDDHSDHPNWFRQGRGIPKGWSEQLSETSPVQDADHQLLCVEIAYAARFDHDDLRVEQRRYFHDDDNDADPFGNEDHLTVVPASLLAEIGYFVVPAHRTRDRILSFGSEIFRKLVLSTGGIPAEELLTERDRLRSPEKKIEESDRLKTVVDRINKEFSHLLPQALSFELRVTATDSESLLQSLIPHYRYLSPVSLPAHRHGSGLVSLQTLILLLEFGRVRRESGSNFILGIEEPELHLAPGLQRRVVHRCRRAAHQTITTTHSPRVASFYDPSEILVIEKREGAVTADRLLPTPLDHSSSNSKRKLFIDSRLQVVEGLLHDFVGVPEGRSDFEILRLLVDAFELQKDDVETEGADFGAVVGLVPTPDAAVADVFSWLRRVRQDVFVLVDGDSAGDSYISTLLMLEPPPSIVIRWGDGQTIEDVLTWIATPILSLRLADLTAELPDTRCAIDNAADFIAALKRSSTESPPGFKRNLLAYETIVRFIREDRDSLGRLNVLLHALLDVLQGTETSMFLIDSRSNARSRVVKWSDATTPV